MTRAEVVTKARLHLHAKFRHQGRNARALDCAGLPLLVAVELGLKDTNGAPFTIYMYGNYGRSEIRGKLLEMCKKHLVTKWAQSQPVERIPPQIVLQPADVLILLNPSVPCHAAIVTMLPALEWGGKPMLGMIHADGTGAIKKGTRPPRGGEQVVEHLIDATWRAKIAGVFSFPGVE